LPFTFGSTPLPNTFGGGFGFSNAATPLMNQGVGIQNLAPGATQGTTVSPLATQNSQMQSGMIPPNVAVFPNTSAYPNFGAVGPFGFGGGVAVIPIGGATAGNQSGQQQLPLEATMTSTAPANSVEAYLEVQLPESAELYVQGQRVDQGGRDRLVTTPPLSGPTQVEVRAEWHDRGQDLTAIQPVTLNPGDYKSLIIISGTPTK
jgi:hypothetical protein